MNGLKKKVDIHIIKQQVVVFKINKCVLHMSFLL